MQLNGIVERTLWAVWLLVVGGSALWVVVGSIGYFSKTGWLPNEAAGWAQVVGSVAAIFGATYIASADRRFTKNNIRAREKVVIRAVEERCLEAAGTIRSLNHELRNYYRPVTLKSPTEIKKALRRVEGALRDLSAIDLMSMPTTAVIDCVIAARAIVQCCRDEALKGWDPAPAIKLPEYSPLEGYLKQIQIQITNLKGCGDSI
ncbi:hypothetical protein J2Y83_002857 [Pseudomonas marginalis]|uniref:hypothetical protein n=1 Tax=Pseudomonas marginalis TaxID=298 RepID=UPI0020A1484C|nr:hypothetical protein [Pseudomonas marginalis]MCP1506884.1 hypothetical protein [Pseudomonas marginalis]MCP1524388.1 hypothetical protein [Pseudomonas marginalis]MDQ0499801.1 hypothetical protein [Pseudomonas marginalis]